MTAPSAPSAPSARHPVQRPPVVPAVPDTDGRVSLVDLLDRVLARGVVVSGEVTLSIAEVDLVHVSLRALLSSVRPDLFEPTPADPERTPW